MKAVREEARRLSKFGIVGVVSNTSFYVVFVVLIRVGVSPVIAAGVCYVLGVALSYRLNRSWTFQSTGKHWRDLPRFLLAYGVGLVSTLATISLLVRWLRPEFAQILNIGITAAVIYVCLRILRFGMEPVHAD